MTTETTPGADSHLSIGEVLEELRGEFPDVTISKIRFLESQGLIDPERTPSGYRRFYAPDLERLRWILLQQRDHFLPLRVIKERLDASGPIGAPGGERRGEHGSEHAGVHAEMRAESSNGGGSTDATRRDTRAQPDAHLGTQRRCAGCAVVRATDATAVRTRTVRFAALPARANNVDTTLTVSVAATVTTFTTDAVGGPDAASSTRTARTVRTSSTIRTGRATRRANAGSATDTARADDGCVECGAGAERRTTVSPCGRSDACACVVTAAPAVGATTAFFTACAHAGRASLRGSRHDG